MLKPAGNSILGFFKSVKLALFLIAYLVITSIISTLLPGGRAFFRSFLFLVPGAFFLVNLSVCTAYRIVTRFERKAPFRPGPDIIHAGLIVVIISGVITLAGRREGFTYLAPGDSMNLPGGYELTLDSFTFEIYRDGRPRTWISRVSLNIPGEGTKKYGIQVNRPLTAGKCSIFQASYRDNSTVTITAAEGADKRKSTVLHVGDTFRTAGNRYRLERVATDLSGLVTESVTGGSRGKERGVFFFPGKEGEQDRAVLAAGSRIGGYILTDVRPDLETGLQIVLDPGFTPLLAGLLLMTTGLAITFWRKIP